MKEPIRRNAFKIGVVFLVMVALSMTMALPVFAQGNNTGSAQAPLTSSKPVITSVNPNQGVRDRP